MASHFRKLSWSENLTSLNTTFATSTSKAFQSEKLQAINERIQAKSQLQTMKNRVKQLKKAQEIAEHDILEAKLKMKKIKKKMKLKEESLLKKNELYKERKDLEEKKREKFNKERIDRQNNIRRFEKRIVKYNKIIADDFKEKSKKWDELIKIEKNKEVEIKSARRKVMSQVYANSLKLRTVSQRDHRDKLREEYSSSIQTEREIQDRALKEISELEKVEAGLLADLSKTMEMRNSYLENLDKLKSMN
jgi:chromosome segregation ATPase